MPDFDSAAHAAATLTPFDCSPVAQMTGELELEREFALAGRPPGQLDLLEPCDQMSMRFAPELLIP